MPLSCIVPANVTTPSRASKQVQHADVQVGKHHPGSEGQHGEREDRRDEDQDWRQRIDETVGLLWRQGFLLDELYRIGDGLEQSERPEPVRTAAPPDTANETPL